ncbi:FUSC family protein [Sphingomonas sp. JC676]|uniref:FUSC family protein n=1 Tax=Sphingomonas sp. JC676 TaxID=2768065 RepID=UPI001657BA04|nr:FUSC family protein [Sphingomonas sp. JC676]MBC9032645.1 FUSC family protein [Sphingomonas sp. JC676]
MAARAASPRALDPHVLLAELLRPSPGRLAFAARLALICALTALLALIYQTPAIALTVYIAFFLNKPDRMGSILTSFVMLLLVTVIIGFIFPVAQAVADHPFWRVVSMTLISFGLLFLASASKLRPVGGIIALIIAYALDLLGSAFGGEIATRGYFYAWLLVGMPFAVSMVVNLLVAPPPRRLAERALARRLALCAAMLTGPSPAQREDFAEVEREGTAEIDSLLHLAGLEGTSPAADLAVLRQASRSILAIMATAALIDHEPADALPQPLRREMADILQAMSAILRRGRYPVEIAVPHEVAATLSPRAAHLSAQLREAIAGFAEPAPAPPAAAHEAGGGFFLTDAFTNPDHVRYALKTTAAAMLCYLLYSLLDWPGIHTCLITCYIVSLTTVGETIQKLTLRILGCLIGAAAGLAAIVYVLPDLTSVGALMAVVFVGVLAAGWVAAGSPKISYTGFQIAFAFLLCLIQGPSPGFELDIARDRVVGILLGNLAVYLIFTQVWPVSVGRQLDTAIAVLLHRLAALATASAPAERRTIASQTRTQLGAIERDLGLAAFEPNGIRHDDAWLTSRHEALDALGAIEQELVASPDGRSAHAASVARRLERVAGQLDASPDAPAQCDPTPSNEPDPSRRGRAFRDMLDRHLHALEALFPIQPQPERSPGNARPIP